MQRIIIVICAAILVGCASTPISERAARIQVHSQYSTLLAKCANLGPITASAQAAGTLDEGFSAAKIKLRELAADKGGDTVVIVNSDRFMHSLYNREQVIQGAALRCY